MKPHGSKSGKNSITRQKFQRSTGTIAMSIGSTLLLEHSPPGARKLRGVASIRNHTRKTTPTKGSHPTVINGMTATKARIEEATEEEARQEAKDHIAATTIVAIKVPATEIQHRMIGHISLVMGPEVSQGVEGDEQTIEEATIATATRLQPLEIIEAKVLVNKQTEALDAAGLSVE